MRFTKLLAGTILSSVLLSSIEDSNAYLGSSKVRDIIEKHIR